MKTTKDRSRRDGVHLFTLRIWSVKQEEAAPLWRSRLHDLKTGDVYFFRDLASLLAGLKEITGGEDCRINLQNNRSVP